MIVIFTSCEAEKEYLSGNNITNEIITDISFSEFLKETEITGFKKTINIANDNQNIGESLDFDVNTTIIKKLELDQKTTYSFRIFPHGALQSTKIYNLTFSFKNGDWIQNIIELKPNAENLDNLLSGSTNQIQGQMSILYSSNITSLTPVNNNFTLEIIGANCNNLEINENCFSRKYVNFHPSEEENISSYQETELTNELINTSPDHSFILNTNNLQENLKIFAKNHVLLNNQIQNILNSEGNINFDDTTLNQLESSTNEENFELVLENSGVVKHAELADLIFHQNQNAVNFLNENKDFTRLRENTRNVILTNAVIEAVHENPINWTPIDYNNNVALLSCKQQFTQDQNDCNEQNNINGTGVVLACVSTLASGPGFFVACGSSSAIAIWQNNTCQRNAKRDYQNCIND